MDITHIAVLGIINENTTEEIILKEIGVKARDHYEAHKVALFKCNLQNNETVFLIKEVASNTIKYSHRKGFIS